MRDEGKAMKTHTHIHGSIAGARAQ